MPSWMSPDVDMKHEFVAKYGGRILPLENVSTLKFFNFKNTSSLSASTFYQQKFSAGNFPNYYLKKFF